MENNYYLLAGWIAFILVTILIDFFAIGTPNNKRLPLSNDRAQLQQDL